MMNRIIVDIKKLENSLPQNCMEYVNEIAEALLKSSLIEEDSGVDYSIKADNGKYKPTLCHQSLIEAVARVREHGGRRYGGYDTWKRVEEQRYRDALYRHWLAYLENPDGIDADSGLPILWHVACNVDFLVEMQKERMKNDILQNKRNGV